MDVQMPDGTIIKNVPDGVTKSQLLAKLNKSRQRPQEALPKEEPTPEKPTPLKPDLSNPKFRKQTRDSMFKDARVASRQALQASTFGLADEGEDAAISWIGSQITGKPYDEVYDLQRQVSQQQLKDDLENYPYLSGAANIVGAIKTGKILAGTSPGQKITNIVSGGLLPKATSIAGRGANVASKVAAGGAASGASSALFGFGTGSGTDDRLEKANEFGNLGVAIGAAIPAVGAAYRGVKSVLKPAGKAARNIVSPPPALRAAEEKILQRLADDDMTLAGVEARMKRNPGSALVEVGRENTQRLGEAVANIPGGGARTAGKYVAQTTAGASKRVKESLGNYIARGDLATKADELMQAGEEAASPLYKAAYEANKDVASPVINRLLKTDAGKKALGYARMRMDTKMSLMGTPDKELLEQAKLVGQLEAKGGVSRGLKLETLQLVKEGYDDQINAAYRSGEKGLARDLTQQKNGLLKELDRMDATGGAYSQARKTWSGMEQGQEALQAGRDFLKSDTSVLRKQFNKYGDTEKELFRIGVAQHMRDLVDAAPDRTNFARKIFGKQEYRDNLQAVLGPDEFKKLRRDMIREDRMHLLNQKLTGNSRTMLRQAEIEDLTQDPSELLTAVASGGKSFGIKQGAQWIANRYQGLNRETSAEIAKILFERDPAKQRDIIMRLQKRAASGNRQALRGYKVIQNAAGISKANQLGILPGSIATMGAE